jgi:hypothetical protein
VIVNARCQNLSSEYCGFGAHALPAFLHRLGWKAIHFLVYVEHILMEGLACYESSIDESGESTEATQRSSKSKLFSSSRNRSSTVYYTEESPTTSDTTARLVKRPSTIVLKTSTQKKLPAPQTSKVRF